MTGVCRTCGRSFETTAEDPGAPALECPLCARHVDVRVRERCAVCRGQGVTADRRYAEFAAACDAWNEANPIPSLAPGAAAGEAFAVWSREQEAMHKAWWDDRGYPGGPKHWPPEEPMCDHCGGTGLMEYWMDIRSLIGLLLAVQGKA